MKNGIWILILFGLACSRPSDRVIGSWQSDSTTITVRMSPEWMEFEFHSDSNLVCELLIDDQFLASGRIGQATFEKARVRDNGFLPDRMTGVHCIVEIELQDPIFPGDPLTQKKVELWVAPVTDNLEAELRYTEKGAHFPMGTFQFFKRDSL